MDRPLLRYHGGNFGKQIIDQIKNPLFTIKNTDVEVV